MGVGVVDGAGDLAGCLRPLNADRQEDHPAQGVALAQNAEHIVDGGSGGRGDDADAVRKGRELLFMGGVEQALLKELLLELLEGDAQIPGPVGEQAGAVELIGPVAGIEADPAHGKDLHPVLRTEAEGGRAAPEQDAADRGFGILEGKIVVTGGVQLIVADLAPDADALQVRVAFELAPDELVELGDG